MDLDMSCKHHHSWMVGDGWLWCVQCGSIAPGEGSNWTLPKNAQAVAEILERVAVVDMSKTAIPNPFGRGTRPGAED